LARSIFAQQDSRERVTSLTGIALAAGFLLEAGGTIVYSLPAVSGAKGSPTLSAAPTAVSLA